MKISKIDNQTTRIPSRLYWLGTQMVNICGVSCSKIVIADFQILGAALLFGVGFIGKLSYSIR